MCLTISPDVKFNNSSWRNSNLKLSCDFTKNSANHVTGRALRSGTWTLRFPRKWRQSSDQSAYRVPFNVNCFFLCLFPGMVAHISLSFRSENRSIDVLNRFPENHFGCPRKSPITSSFLDGFSFNVDYSIALWMRYKISFGCNSIWWNAWPQIWIKQPRVCLVRKSLMTWLYTSNSQLNINLNWHHFILFDSPETALQIIFCVQSDVINRSPVKSPESW